MSNKLTFGELKEGDEFIDFPTDGDNDGHGGYKVGYRLLKKVKPIGIVGYHNSTNRDGTSSHIPDSMTVIKIV